MAYKTGILLGRITKASGFTGSVTVKLDKTYTEYNNITEPVFLEIEGKPVPFFISESEYSGGDTMKLRFEGYETQERTAIFTGARVYLSGHAPAEETDDDFQSFAGYHLVDQDNNLVGDIDEVIQNPGQLLLKVISPDKREILVPLHENLIISIKKRRKLIIMDIPEGLTEIN